MLLACRSHRGVDVETWVHLKQDSQLQAQVARVVSVGGSVELTDVVSVLLMIPQMHDVIRVESDDVDGLHQFVPKTRIFYEPLRAKELGWDACVAVSVFAATSSLPLGVAAGIAQRALRTFKLLTEDEMDVVLVMRALCGADDPFFTTISRAALDEVYEDTGADLDARLKSLEKKGVVTRTDSGWRLVP
jgi:hypothetical protein